MSTQLWYRWLQVDPKAWMRSNLRLDIVHRFLKTARLYNACNYIEFYLISKARLFNGEIYIKESLSLFINSFRIDSVDPTSFELVTILVKDITFTVRNIIRKLPSVGNATITVKDCPLALLLAVQVVALILQPVTEVVGAFSMLCSFQKISFISSIGFF